MERYEEPLGFSLHGLHVVDGFLKDEPEQIRNLGKLVHLAKAHEQLLHRVQVLDVVVGLCLGHLHLLLQLAEGAGDALVLFEELEQLLD